MKAIVIVNPHANSGQQPPATNTFRDGISARLKDVLHLESVEWCETQQSGHGKALAHDAISQGFDYIFAGGGDGTINEVLNGIMEQHLPEKERPTFGVLPFGTSNDFFAALSIAEAAHRTNGEANLILNLDVGHVWFDTVERYFCLTAGMGLLSWANEQYLDSSHVFGRRFAHIPAAIRTVLGYQFSPQVKISRDGKRTQSRRILSALVNNSPIIAGGTPLTPDARIDDGWFDFCLIRSISLVQFLWLMVQVQTKTHRHSRTVAMGQIREITITAKQPLPIHLDGELVPEIESKARRMVVQIMPAALRIVAPSICGLTPTPEPIPAAG
jgi:diacylglycerol kinase (ATP)